MILEEATKEAFGYYPSDLKPQSGKPIIATCELCGEFRVCKRQNYHTLCKSCIQKGKHQTEEHKAKLSATMKGNTNCLGSTLTEEHKANIRAGLKGKNLGENNPRYNGGKKVSNARHHVKRINLGHNVLMPVKEDEHNHHVTNEDTIGVPADVHNSISGSRKKHRTKVLQWLKVNDKKKYNMALCVLAGETLK